MVLEIERVGWLRDCLPMRADFGEIAYFHMLADFGEIAYSRILADFGEIGVLSYDCL